MDASGQLVISVSDAEDITLRDINSPRESRTSKGHEGKVKAVAVAPDQPPDQPMAVSGSDDKTVRLWDLQTGKNIATFVGDGAITCVAAAGKGLFVAGEDDGAVHILMLKENKSSSSELPLYRKYA